MIIDPALLVEMLNRREDERQARLCVHGVDTLIVYCWDCEGPMKCSHCDGTGRVWRYRMDDRRYPVKCACCDGLGIAPPAKQS